MRKPAILLISFFLTICIYAQTTGGTVLRKTFTAVSLRNNKVGESAERKISIYLPPGYEKSNQRYPVIYYLHGYTDNDSLMMNEWVRFKQLLDTAILKGKIRSVILVLPDSETKLGGSFYTNSEFAGNWADYIAKDVVQYIDRNYRTIDHRNSRGLAGHSMGGNGALKVGMLYSDVFGAVYAMSPAVLNWYGDFTVANSGFQLVTNANNEEEIMKGITSFEGFHTAAIAALARAYSSNGSGKKLQIDLPVEYKGDSSTINVPVLKKWEARFPYNMIDDHIEQLKSLMALKLDWGRNDEFTHIPFTALQFSKKLEAYGIPHFAEEYVGDHGNKLNGFDGRVYTEMLPFFDAYLK